MSNECLIDFDPYPEGCPAWYDDGDTKSDGFNNLADWSDVYYDAHVARMRALSFAMRTRILSQPEEEEAYKEGYGLVMESGFHSQDEQLRYSRELNDLWFQQRRLQSLARMEATKP